MAGPFDVRTGCTPQLYFELIPHWSPMAFVETAPAPRALQVDWTRAGGSVRIPVTPASGHGDALDFRIAGEPGAAPVELDVRVRDAAGRWTALGSRPMTLRSYHGPAPLGKVVARQLRAPLRGFDASRITGIELIPRTPRGRFWLLDVSTKDRDPCGERARSICRRSVSGGSSCRRAVAARRRSKLPVTIEGEVTKRARALGADHELRRARQPDFRIPAGARARRDSRDHSLHLSRRRRVQPVRAADAGDAARAEERGYRRLSPAPSWSRKMTPHRHSPSTKPT